MSTFTEHISKTIESTKTKLQTVRTGRANPDLLSRVSVGYYGSQVPINQVANITASEGNMLLVNVFDQNAVQATEKALQQSDLGLNPQIEGSLIRLRLPDLTEDRRQDLVKIVKQQIEEGKVSLRNIRRDHLDKLKNGELSEDDQKREQANIQSAIDAASKDLDNLGKAKESEIMTI
jgi:ribosome recycling factor